MKTKNKILVIFISIFGILFLNFSVYSADPKNIGDSCVNNTECKTNLCATSSLKQENNKFCACSSDKHCEDMYGKEADETWTCKPGIDKSNNLAFCESNKKGIKIPATTTPASTPEDKASTTAKVKLTPPKINIPIPELPAWTALEVTAGEIANIPYIAEYIIAIYKYSLIIGSILAVAVLMIGGIMYMMGGMNATLISRAKNLIFGSISGIVILILSYLTLNIINPNLTQLGTIELQTVEPIEYEKQDLPEEYIGANDAMVEAEFSGAVPSTAGDFSQKKFYDKCGDPGTMIAIANKFLAQPLCQGPCHCAPTIVRWLVQSGCDPKLLKGAGLVSNLKKRLYNDFKYPDGSPMYIERPGDDTEHLSPGDILFIKNAHVGMFYGGGYSVDSGTGAGNQKVCFKSGCPPKIWDSYGTDKCAFCSLIPDQSPKTVLWARGKLASDLKSGKRTENLCYKIWNGLSLSEEEKSGLIKTFTKNKKCNLSDPNNICHKITNNIALNSAEKKKALDAAPSYCSSCVSNQCVAKNKWPGVATNAKKWGFNSYADYQPPK